MRRAETVSPSGACYHAKYFTYMFTFDPPDNHVKQISLFHCTDKEMECQSDGATSPESSVWQVARQRDHSVWPLSPLPFTPTLSGKTVSALLSPSCRTPAYFPRCLCFPSVSSALHRPGQTPSGSAPRWVTPCLFGWEGSGLWFLLVVGTKARVCQRGWKPSTACV